MEVNSDTDKKILYNVEFEVKELNQNNIQMNKRVIPTLISRAIEAINNSNIPEELDQIIKDHCRIRFIINGYGVNIEFDLKGKVR